MATQKFLNYAGLQHYNDKILEKVGNKELVHLIISYDSSLSGATITAKNGSEVHTATATTSGQTIISGVNLGTWTISENKQNTSAQITAVYYGNYSVAIGGDKFITVSFDSEFIGKTITCSNGTDTQTRVASGSSVQFCFKNNGTYTIKATVDSKEYSTSVVVNGAGTYTANLHYATGLDYTEWLSSANITTSFASLDAVLADQKTVRELFTKHSSVDFLVDYADDTENMTKIFNAYYSKKWINLRDYALDKLMSVSAFKTLMDSTNMYGYGEVTKDSSGNVILKGCVPTMTSNTAPYGEAIKDVENTTDRQYSYCAFDNSDSTVWSSTNTALPHYIGYKFTNPVCVRGIKYKAQIKNLKDYKVQGSNDGSTWTDIYTGQNPNESDHEEFVTFDNDNYYLYYRMLVSTSYNGNWVAVYSLQFYGRTLNVSVPTMTSNTAPWGEVFSNYVTQANAYGTFSENELHTGTTSNPWVGYDFGKKVGIKFAKLHASCAASGTSIIKLIWSDNKTTWNDASEGQIYVKDKIYYVNSTENEAHRYWGVTLSETGRGYAFYSCNLYGLDYSEREFESGSTMKYLYDHGVEFCTLTENVIAGNPTYEYLDDEIRMSKNADATGSALVTNTLIDSSVNVMRMVFHSLKVASSWLGVFNNPTAYNDNYLSMKTIAQSELPSNNYLDCSSITNGYSAIVVNGNEYFEIAEWWLE